MAVDDEHGVGGGAAPAISDAPAPAPVAAPPVHCCLLATMPRHIVLHILYSLDRRNNDLNTLRGVGRVFALPQPLFPAARSLVVHTRLFGAEAEYRASVRRAQPVDPWVDG